MVFYNKTLWAGTAQDKRPAIRQTYERHGMGQAFTHNGVMSL